MAQDDTPPTREDPPDPAPAAGGFTPGPDAQALIATTQRDRPIAPIGQGGMGAV